MPHVISDRDFSKLIEAHAGKPTMEDVYTKLAEAETDIQTGMVSDAMEENTVYLIWLFHGRQEHEKLI